MLEHAKAMGFVVPRQSHGQIKPAAKKAVATKVVAKKAAAKKVAVKKPAVKQALAKEAAAKKVSPAPAAKKVAAAKSAPATKAVPVKPAVVKPTAPPAVKVAANVSTGAAIGPVSASAASLPGGADDFLDYLEGSSCIHTTTGFVPCSSTSSWTSASA